MSSLAVAALLVTMSRMPAVADRPADSAPVDAQNTPEGPAASRFLPTLGHNLVDDVKHIPRRNSIYWLVAGAGATAAIHPADKRINEELTSWDSADAFFKPGHIIGSTPVQLGSSIATYIVGAVSDKPRVRHLGMDLLEAQLLSEGIVQGIKAIVRRERPDQSSGFSFPSGHATITMASATVLQQHLGWKAAVPTYAIATSWRFETARQPPLGERRGRGGNGGYHHRPLSHVARTEHLGDDSVGRTQAGGGVIDAQITGIRAPRALPALGADGVLQRPGSPIPPVPFELRHPHPRHHDARAHGEQPNQHARDDVTNRRHPGAVTQEAMGLDLERGECRECPEEADAEREPQRVRTRRRFLRRHSAKDAENERTADVDEECCEREPGVNRQRDPAPDNEARVRADEAAEPDQDVRQQPSHHRRATIRALNRSLCSKCGGRLCRRLAAGVNRGPAKS